MGIRLPSLILNAKHICKLHTRNQSDVPKGHMAVYVGEIQKKRFVVPISYLNHPSFQELLLQAEEEFGFNHPMGGLTIPCREDAFIGLTARLNGSWKKWSKEQSSTILVFLFFSKTIVASQCKNFNTILIEWEEIKNPSYHNSMYKWNSSLLTFKVIPQHRYSILRLSNHFLWLVFGRPVLDCTTLHLITLFEQVPTAISSLR